MAPVRKTSKAPKRSKKKPAAGKRAAVQKPVKKKKTPVRASKPAKKKAVRFSPGWLKSLRKRLNLSAYDFAHLVGVSAITVYFWHWGRSKPSPEHLDVLASLEDIDEKEARRRLKKMLEEARKQAIERMRGTVRY
jgi:DNA-binding transcriptional regulator YiaG